MRHMFWAALAAAIIAATPATAHMGEMGGGGSGGFGHGGHQFHFGPLPFPFHEQRLMAGFPNARFGEARFEGWGGGAYGGDVEAYDPDEGDFTAEDLHFRVQEPFGPGDVGRRPPPGPYASGPWEGAGQDAWDGYESDDR
jgi:hypothetical protein